MKVVIAAFLNFFWNEFVTHIPVHFLRILFLRISNRTISRSCVVLMHTRILNFWNVTIKDRAVINQYVLIDCRRSKVIIEEDADIGPYTRIWTTGHQPDSESHEIYHENVTIGHHSWIASGVTILPGANIGSGAVVASGAVVTKSVPPQEIWGGNPARFIRKRANSLLYKLNYTPYFE